MDATVLLTVNIMDNIFTIERCVPRSRRSGSRSRWSGWAMEKIIVVWPFRTRCIRQMSKLTGLDRWEKIRRHPFEGHQYFKVWLGGLVEAPHNSKASIRRDSINQRFSISVELIPTYWSRDDKRREAPWRLIDLELFLSLWRVTVEHIQRAVQRSNMIILSRLGVYDHMQKRRHRVQSWKWVIW